MDISVDLDAGARLILRGVSDDGAMTNGDVELTDAEGQRWAATVMTLAEVGRLMDVWRSSGECQDGAFFRVPDLIIVRDAAEEAVVQVFSDLLQSGEYQSEMAPLLEA